MSARTTVTFVPPSIARRTAEPRRSSNSRRSRRPVSGSRAASSVRRRMRRWLVETSRTVRRWRGLPSRSSTTHPETRSRTRSPWRRRNVSSEASSPRATRSACQASTSCRCSGGQNGNGARGAEQLLALVAQQLAEAAVHRADLAVADEDEPVGDRGQQVADGFRLGVEGLLEPSAGRAAEPEREQASERERKCCRGREPESERSGAASRAKTTATTVAIPETRRSRSSSFVRRTGGALTSRPSGCCARTCASPCRRGGSATSPSRAPSP